MNSVTNSPIKIVVIENNRFIRDGLEIMFKAESDFELVSSYSSCEDAFRSGKISNADIVLMDIRLPGVSGIEGIKYLKHRFPLKLIIACTALEDDEEVFEAISAGAVGFVSKKTPSKELLSILRNVYKGGSPMTPNVAAKINFSFQKEISTRDKTFLTQIEREVLDKISQGKSYSAVAKELSESEEDILWIIRSVYTKLQKQVLHTKILKEKI